MTKWRAERLRRRARRSSPLLMSNSLLATFERNSITWGKLTWTLFTSTTNWKSDTSFSKRKTMTYQFASRIAGCDCANQLDYEKVVQRDLCSGTDQLP